MFKLSFPQTKFWLFSRKLNNFLQKGIHTLKPLGTPVVEMSPKPELSEDQRKQTLSRLLLLVKEDTLTVERNWRVLIYIG
jgi:hypothetical protein